MVNDYKAQRAVVILGNGKEREPEPSALYGFEKGSIWSDPTVPHHLLRMALDYCDEVFYLDAHQEASLPESMPPSILCIPLGVDKPYDGLLYCDHSDPGFLDHSKRKELSQLAQDFDHRYLELRAEARLPTIPENDFGDVREAQKHLTSLKWATVAFTIASLFILYMNL